MHVDLLESRWNVDGYIYPSKIETTWEKFQKSFGTDCLELCQDFVQKLEEELTTLRSNLRSNLRNLDRAAAYFRKALAIHCASGDHESTLNQGYWRWRALNPLVMAPILHNIRVVEERASKLEILLVELEKGRNIFPNEDEGIDQRV